MKLAISAVFCLVLGSINASERRKSYSICHKDPSTSFHDFTTTDVGGRNVSLSKLSGHVVLAVNVATFCGFTSQYIDLNALQQELKGSTEDLCGLRIVGFPCNQFGFQEPAENIYELMNGLKYVRPGHGFQPNFLLLEKRDVNGENEDEIYTFFKSRCPAPDGFIDDISAIRWSPVRNNDINWNFEKVLIDHEGQPVARYTAPYEPMEIRDDILQLIQECRDKTKQKRY
ncbi:epididymal secretory glutathione peroxidase-like [Montipora foliosa]|uniref:epididymal secretory glutathione peroxidase-like n=1 Tax=Montipora foliosa TaxID=591990 RepID=UPI0035F1F4A8